MTAVRRLWHVAKELVLLELALYRSLARWVVRRPDVPHDATAVGYAQLAAPMIWLWIFGSAVEVVVLDVVLHRWVPAIRMPVLFLSIWGLLWMLGLLASYRVRPHLITDTALVARSGARTRVVVPLRAVASVRRAEHELPGLVRSLHQDDDLLLVGVSSRTNLELVLVAPTTVETNDGPRTVSRVGVWVDDPAEVAGVLRRRSSAPSR